MPELRKCSKLSSNPSFRLLRFFIFLFSTQMHAAYVFDLQPPGPDFSFTHSLQSLRFSTASRLRNKWWKKKCCELSNLLTKHPSRSLLRFLRRVSVYHIFCGHCFLPNYVTSSIWTKFDAAFRSIPLTWVARGVYPAKTRGLPVTEVKSYFSIIIEFL